MNELLENNISFRRAPPIGLHARNVTIRASKTNKILVDSFSIDLPSGSVMAVMGGSGSGKTTLLNVLASKISKGLHCDGEIHYVVEDNNDDLSVEAEASMAYLPQQDVLSAKLTCRETLQMAADLKLRNTLEEKDRIVDQLLLELGLRDCSNTLVGDSRRHGLSGGEKRRLSVATQLVSNPSIMFLDEPTTGLDAYSAFLLVNSLAKLAREGQKSFIMSIHQPRSDILFLLDFLCIFSRGRITYCGPTVEMIPYFESIGYPVPPLVNPADYFIDLSSVDTRTEHSKEESQWRLDELLQHWSDFQSQAIRLPTVDPSKSIRPRNMAARVSFWRQVKVLTKRNVKLNCSDYFTLIAIFAEPALVGTIMGWIFYKPNPRTQQGLRTLTSSLYASIVLQCYLYLLFDTYRLTEQDILLYDRERAEGIVTPASFMLARKLSLFLTDDIMTILIFVTITYFMIGLEADCRKFFLHFAVVFLIQLSCSGLALFSVAISRDFSKASLVGNMSFTILSLACGFFVNAKSMPVYVRWTKYVAFTWYGFGALVSNTFTDSLCHSNESYCEGNSVINTLGFWPHWRKLPLSILFCFSVGYFIAALIILYIKKVDIVLQKEVKPKRTGKTGNPTRNGEVPLNHTIQETYIDKEVELEPNIVRFAPIMITLQDINLKVTALHLSKSYKQWWCQKKTKKILQDINAVFKPRMINAIMGPSGCGKSSLLNLMSGRLASSLVSKFCSSGSMFLNNNSISQGMFKSVCSYVSQDDSHLLASLTVRETFEFAASLRLRYTTSQQRQNKIDEIIRMLGLTHCENTLLGTELTKGISGGEKRRVSIGVQLLNDPPLLLLDEPTSGLDSFTSAAILEILEKLCIEACKTVIITIHQPRSEIFQKFGHVLFLAKSGKAVFNGSPNEMIKYFGDLGYVYPEYTNVADYFLDLISINTQNKPNEILSSKRVENLLVNWRQKGNGIREETLLLNLNVMSKEEFLAEYGEFIKKPCNAGLAYVVNLKRQCTTTRRNMDSLMARIAQVPGSGIIFALYWAPIKHNFASVGNRLGLVQQSTALYFIGMLANLACYPPERDYFYGEYSDNVHGIAPFFLAYMTLELLLTAFSASMYSVFMVLVCGLPRTASNFFVTMYCSFVIITCGEALGIMTNTFFRRPGFVVNCISVILSIGTQLSGLMSLHMSRVLKGINYLNPLNYTSMLLINYAFPSNMKLTCYDGGRKEDGNCQFSNGYDVLREYGLIINTQKYLGIIICVMIIYRSLSYWILKAKLEWFKW